MKFKQHESLRTQKTTYTTINILLRQVMNTFDIRDNDNDTVLTTIKLIDGEDAIQEFSKIDLFISNMSTFDLQSRLNTTDPEKSTTDHYIQFITQHILNWTPFYAKLISDIIDDLTANSIDILRLSRLPKEILILLTNGEEESGAAYCRNMDMIVLPITKLGVVDITTEPSVKDLAKGFFWNKTLKHELYHIISRNNPDMRDKMYRCIGYKNIPDDKVADLPEHLAHLKITNPDAPITKHYIKLRSKDTNDKVRLAPVLLADSSYANDGRSFFDYLQVRFLVLDNNFSVTDNMLSYDDVIGFYDKIGDNTDYIIHPEEILADNYVLLLNHVTDAKSPEVLKKLLEVLMTHK